MSWKLKERNELYDEGMIVQKKDMVGTQMLGFKQNEGVGTNILPGDMEKDLTKEMSVGPSSLYHHKTNLKTRAKN